MIDTMYEQGRDLGISSFFLPSSYDPDIAKGVAQFCYEWRDAVDGIIITGDLAATGMSIDVAVANKFVTSPAVSGYVADSRFPTLQAAGLPIHLFAGNHDRFVNERGRPFSNHFDFVFEHLMDKRSDFIGSWVSEKQGRSLAFLYADFTLRTRAEAEFPAPIMAFGQGRIYDDVLADLRMETLRLRRENGNISVVWMVHFAPYECGSSLRLIDHQKLLDAAKALGVFATVCGHTHESLVKKLDTQVIYCGGSACCVEAVGGCKVHVLNFSIDDVPSVNRSTFAWSEDDSEFIHFKDD